MDLAQLETTFKKWLHLPDAGALYVMLAAVVANRAEGDPVWLLLVGPPSGGKSELLTSVYGLPDVHPAATLTEASLLSGTPNRERADSSKGGMLREIGDFGIIVAKDFTSVLSMNKDNRALLLSALREIYDGAWTRHVGSDGGRKLHWQGKVGFVGGVTPAIDRQHAVMGAMGERFVMYRLPPADEEAQARSSLAQSGKETTMRKQLSAAVEAFLAGVDQPSAPIEDDIDYLVALATFVVRGRSAVERDSYTRDIEQIYPPEAPNRIIKVLSRLARGLDSLGVDHDTVWRLVTKVALDSMPELRLTCLLRLYHHGSAETPQIAEALGYPTVTVRRTLEDLTGHGLALRTIRGQGRQADTWGISDFARQRLGLCSRFSFLSGDGEHKESLGTLNGAVPTMFAGTSGTQQERFTDGSEDTDFSGTQRFTDGNEPENGIPF